MYICPYVSMQMSKQRKKMKKYFNLYGKRVQDKWACAVVRGARAKAEDEKEESKWTEIKRPEQESNKIFNVFVCDFSAGKK